MVVWIWLALALSADIKRPWVNGVDYNGAVWSQAAHNILRAGLAETAGASTGFYFGPLPIPEWGYYLHHPPLLHLMIASLFALLGEHEWVARLVPIGCSLASVLFLWLLVRSAVGVRAATLSAAIFASLPMELRYGQMVNFEPCVLMLILGALLCLRYRQVSGRASWQWAALGFILVGLWVDWAMYLFVVALCAFWLPRARPDERRFVLAAVAGATLSGTLYLLRIHSLRPEAWHNLIDTFLVRLGSGKGGYFTEAQWITRVGKSLVTHFLPMGWILAAIGAAILFRGRVDGLRWLGRACGSVFLMDALFVAIFQNDSYIHHYISFYFIAPIAVAAGIALDRLVSRWRAMVMPRRFRGTGELAVILLVIGIGMSGWSRANALNGRFQILDYTTAEPVTLIPELGKAIRATFPSGTHVLCNFLPDFGPHLAYYAQRDIRNNLSEYRFWRTYLDDPSARVGGVVWVTSSAASQNIMAKLPAGTKRLVTIENLQFCLWKRDSPVK